MIEKLIVLIKILFTLTLPSKEIEVKLPEMNLVKVQQVVEEMQQDVLINEVLDSISRRESGFHFMKEKAYKLISPTHDFGKYQLNSVHFQCGGVCYGISYQEFLNNPVLQERKARELMKLHIKILKQYNKAITKQRLHKSWYGIAYAIYN